MKRLYKSLSERRRPEDVAEMVLGELRGQLSRDEEKKIERAAKGSLVRRVWGYTSMLQEFARPVGLQRQVAKAAELFATVSPLSAEECDDPQRVEKFIIETGEEIRKQFGASSFKYDRLNQEARLDAGLGISKRRYNKLFRHLARMERKLLTLARELKKREFQMIGKSSLATKITWEDFSSDKETACFIAYYTARCNLRSEFTIYGQQRPYDEISDMLFARCRNNPQTNWWAIAHVYPSAEVLAHLTDEQKGELLGRWFTILQEIARLLKETWERSDINRRTMVVRRGNDSSTWNNTAGAWNKARDHWIALLDALGMSEMLEVMCFGKVLRLMAADVVMWHQSVGNTLDPDTAVWNELPLPWEVLSGEATCTRSKVEEVCFKHGVDPVKNGWTAPRPRNVVAEFRPTPELVHGVTVGNPFLAKILRQAGYFSGKSASPVIAAEG